MKRLKDIFAALKTLGHVPSEAIKNAADHVLIDAEHSDANSNGNDRQIIAGILAAVVLWAEEMERPKATTATTPEKS